MNGDTIKKKLRVQGISIKQVAEILGESQQNLSAALQKDDVKTGLLERIAEAIGVPTSFFYTDNSSHIVSGNGNAVGNNSINNASSEMFMTEIAEQRKLTAKAQEQIDRLLAIIESVTNK